jgi:hypothetical protein
MIFNIKFNLVFVLVLNSLSISGQGMYVRLEIVPRLTGAYQNPASTTQPTAQLKKIYGNRIALTSQGGMDFGWNNAAHRGWELGVHYGYVKVKAFINSPKRKNGFGNLNASFTQAEFPLRFHFPIYLNAAIDDKKNKALKYMIGTIGIQYGVIGVSTYSKEATIVRKESDGSKKTLYYEMIQNRKGEFGGFSIEFGVGNHWKFKKNLLLAFNIRASIGITPVAAYEVKWYSIPSSISGNSNILVKNDALSFSFGLIQIL